MIKLDRVSQYAAERLLDAGGVPYVVGGAVRDTLLKRDPKDFDLLVTGIDAMDIPRILPGAYETGEAFGVFRWRLAGDEVEIALPRTEVSTGPGHKDFEATIRSDIPVEDDLARRDFTVNAMAWDIFNSQLIDNHGGQYDIERRAVRMVKPQAFKDDPLRILRGLVLVARYGFWIEDDLTGYHMAWSAERIQNLPAERIQEELDKIFEGDYPDLAIESMHEYGVMEYVFPELEEHWNYNQNNPHHQKILGLHQLSTLRYISNISKDADLRLAGLLHDIGKPASAWVDPVTGSNHFYMKKWNAMDWLNTGGSVLINVDWVSQDEFVIGQNHEDVGADMVRDRLTQLKYPTRRIDRIVALVRSHMWNPFTSAKGARKFLNKYGDLADDLLTLRYGDQGGKSLSPTNHEHDLNAQDDLLSYVRDHKQATSTSDLAINGHDLIDAGFKPGPIMGEILEYLMERVVDEPSLNTKEMLIAIAEDTFSGALR